MHRVLWPYERTGKHGLATTYHVGDQDMEFAVRTALALDDAQRSLLQANARRWFEQNDERFRGRTAAVLCE
jgi:hypothetical protein